MVFLHLLGLFTCITGITHQTWFLFILNIHDLAINRFCNCEDSQFPKLINQHEINCWKTQISLIIYFMLYNNRSLDRSQLTDTPNHRISSWPSVLSPSLPVSKWYVCSKSEMLRNRLPWKNKVFIDFYSLIWNTL